MREIVHVQAGQCGNQIGAKVCGKHKLKMDTVNIMDMWGRLAVLMLGSLSARTSHLNWLGCEFSG